jgi:uncharacterized membrane protein YadS
MAGVDCGDRGEHRRIAHLASRDIALLNSYQMITAIILGAFVQNVIGSPAAATEGVTFCLRRILRLSIPRAP